MSGPQISVVMSVYNGARYLSEAIDSILQQSFADFEFIIIDDGSTDGTADVLARYAKQDTRIRVFAHPNRGLTYSLNLGCDLARTTLIARMDADDIAIKDRFLWQMQFMNKHPEVGLLGGAYDLIDAHGKRLCSAQLPTEDQDIRLALRDSTAFLHPAVVMRKETFDRAGRYRGVKYAEDYDLWLRIAECGKVANLSQVVLHYRIHPDQVSVSKCKEQALWTDVAQAGAAYRNQGKQDFIDSLVEVSPDVLEELGVSKDAQQATLARAYLRYIRNMSRIGEVGLALRAFEALCTEKCALTEKWIIADSYLWASGLYLRQGRFMLSAVSIWKAVIARPLILGRPLRSCMRRFVRLLQILPKDISHQGSLRPDTKLPGTIL